MEHLYLNLDDIFDGAGNCIQECTYDFNNVEYITLYRKCNYPIKIGNNFLCNRPKLLEVYIQECNNVCEIGNYFLYGCKQLLFVDLTSFKSIKYIGHNFMEQCVNLSLIHFPHFSKIISIGNNFLSGCKNLGMVKMYEKHVQSKIEHVSPKTPPIKISPKFNMYGFSKSPPPKFISSMLKNTNLPKFMLPPAIIPVPPIDVPKIVTLGNNFMSDCINLHTNDLSLLFFDSSTENTNVSLIIGDNFMFQCENLCHILFPKNMTITKAGKHFMSKCSNLHSIDLSPMSKITCIESCFLHACENLTTIDLKHLSNVKTIDKYFLFGCINLLVDISYLKNVKHIESGFCGKCKKTTNIHINNFDYII